MAVPTLIVSALNTLVETCKDGEHGFRAAAHGVTNPRLKEVFSTFARQRGQFVAELQGEIIRLGGRPEAGGSVTAALQRGWMNIKSVVTGGDDSSIVEECERGEDSAKAAYERALSAPLPDSLRPLVERQYTDVKQALDQIRDLRHRAA